MAETDKIVFGSQPFQFPVGYILMSANNINPATFLNYGVWSLIGNGRTILGATEDDNGEETGGSMSKTLSASNIPGHTHSIPAHTHQVPSHGHTASSGSSGTHKHRYGNEGWGVYGTTDTAYKYKSDSYSGNLSGSGYKLIRLPESESFNVVEVTLNAGSHSHSITVANKAAFNTGSGGSGNTGSYGSATAFDITPSYIKLFIWKRIE